MAIRTNISRDAFIHLGGYLAEEIGARRISQKELVESMKRPVNTINETINTKRLSSPR